MTATLASHATLSMPAFPVAAARPFVQHAPLPLSAPADVALRTPARAETPSGLPLRASVAEVSAYCRAHGVAMQEYPRTDARPSDRNFHDLLFAETPRVDDALTFADTLDAECPRCAKAAMIRHDIGQASNRGSVVHARWVLAAARRVPCARHEAGAYALAPVTRD